MEATNAIINAIEATNATVDQLVKQGNELCDDVDNLRAADERLGKELADLRAVVEANKGTIAAQSVAVQLNNDAIEANKEAIASQAKDLADLRAVVEAQAKELANDVVNLRAIVEAQAKEIADLRAAIGASKDAAPSPADTPDMAALIARIPKPDAVRTRAAAQPVEVVEQPVEVVEQPVEAPAPSKPAPRKEAAKPAPRKTVQNNAVETRAYARQYMIENGAKVEQLRDPAAIEATVASDAFAAWLAAR